MGSNTYKIIGYILLAIGLILIIFALYSVYEVFTNVSKPPDIFQLKEFKFALDFGADRPPSKITIPLDSDIRKLINLFMYYIFMFFILGAGSRISAMGIQLIREIKIEAKGEGK